MGPNTNWLYQLIFDEVSRLWELVLEQGSTELFGPPPGYLLIREHAEADWTEILCSGPVLRQWRYTGSTMEECPATDEMLHVSQAQKAFYPYGLVQFHVSSDRKRIAYTYLMGPRYARGVVFRVREDVSGHSLELDPNVGEWVS
jgi:hypothetical protein